MKIFGVSDRYKNTTDQMSFTWSVFGHSLGFLRHGVFGQFSGQQQTHGGLDLSRCDGGALVVVSER